MADGDGGLESDVPLAKSDVFDALSSLGKTETNNIERRSERLSEEEENVVVGDDDALRDEIVEEVRKEFPARPQGLREEWEEKTGVGRKEVVGIVEENVREEKKDGVVEVVREEEKESGDQAGIVEEQAVRKEENESDDQVRSEEEHVVREEEKKGNDESKTEEKNDQNIINQDAVQIKEEQVAVKDSLLEEETKRLRKELETLSLDYENIIKTLDETRVERDGWKDRFENLQTNLGACNSKSESLENENADCQENLKTVTNQLLSANQYASELVSQKQTAESLLRVERQKLEEKHNNNNEIHLRGKDESMLTYDDAFGFFQNENILWSVAGFWVVILGLYFVYRGMYRRGVEYDDEDDDDVDDEDRAHLFEDPKLNVKERNKYEDEDEESLGGDWDDDWSDGDDDSSIKPFVSSNDSKRMTSRSPIKKNRRLVLKTTPKRGSSSSSRRSTPSVTKRNDKDNIFAEFGMTPVLRKND